MSKLLYGMDTDLGDEEDLAVFEADFELVQAALFASLKSETFSKGHEAVKRIKERLAVRFSAALEKRRAAIGAADADNRQLPAAFGGLNAMEVVADMLLSEGTADDEEVLEEAVDHLYLLFEASHGTTMYATTSLLYLLSLPANCQALECVRAEVNQVMPSGLCSSSPGLTTLKSEMPFCEACIKEALRLVPLVGTVEFRIANGATLSLRGREVPGLNRLFFTWGSWYEDEAAFAEPKQFVPGRWIDGHEAEAGELAKAVFRPFGMGRHVCLGSQLAMLVLKCWLVSFAEDPGRELLFDENATKIVGGLFPEKRVDGFRARVGTPN